MLGSSTNPECHSGYHSSQNGIIANNSITPINPAWLACITSVEFLATTDVFILSVVSPFPECSFHLYYSSEKQWWILICLSVISLCSLWWSIQIFCPFCVLFLTCLCLIFWFQGFFVHFGYNSFIKYFANTFPNL